MVTVFIGRWLATRDEEYWVYTGTSYATREEAIEKAPTDLRLGPNELFFVGLAGAVKYESIDPCDPDEVLDCAAEKFDDINGMVDGDGDPWPDAKQEHIKELGTRLNAVFQQWVKEFAYEPRDRCVISKDEPHRAPSGSVLP